MPNLLVTTNSLVILRSSPVLRANDIYPSSIISAKRIAKTLLELFGAGHSCDEPVVKFLGRVIAGELEFDLKRSYFDQPRQVASGPHRNRNVRNIDTQNLYILILHAQPIDVQHLVPRLQ